MLLEVDAAASIVLMCNNAGLSLLLLRGEVVRVEEEATRFC